MTTATMTGTRPQGSRNTADRIRRLLEDQGRSMTWLADRLSVSRSTLYRVLDKAPSDRNKQDLELLDQAATELGLDLLTADFYRGRAVTLPRTLISQLPALSNETRAHCYEEAWKQAWVREHGPEVIAAAADRAWSCSTELAERGIR